MNLGLLLCRTETGVPADASPPLADVHVPSEAVPHPFTAGPHMVLWDDAADRDALPAQRWGVIAPAGEEGTKLLAAIEKLVARRAEQQNIDPKSVKIYRAPSPMTQEQATQWIQSQMLALAESEQDLPRYLLILGDFHQVPLELQQVLALRYYPGRLAFDKVEDYAAYADKVLRAEDQSGDGRPQGRALMLTSADGSPETNLGYSQLMHPACQLAARQARAGSRLQLEELTPDSSAPQEQLLQIAGDPRPTLLWTMSHGYAPLWTRGESDEVFYQKQRQQNGSPQFGSSLLPASKVASGAFLPNGIWFCFACFSAGTPAQSTYNYWLERLSKESNIDQTLVDKALDALAKKEPFVAAVPKAALANPQGPLAFFGHVDLAWTYSFSDKITGSATSPLQRYLRVPRYLADLNQPRRAGVAYNSFVASDLAEILDSLANFYDVEQKALLDQGRSPFTQAQLAQRDTLWMLRQDLRAFILLGDPAVRMPIGRRAGDATAAPGGVATAVPVISTSRVASPGMTTDPAGAAPARSPATPVASAVPALSAAAASSGAPGAQPASLGHHKAAVSGRPISPPAAVAPSPRAPGPLTTPAGLTAAPTRIQLQFARKRRSNERWCLPKANEKYQVWQDGRRLGELSLAWAQAKQTLAELYSNPQSAKARTEMGVQLRAFLGDRWNDTQHRLTRDLDAGTPVCLEFCLQDAVELYALPWELLTPDPEEAPMGARSLVRYCYQRDKDPAAASPAKRSRILVASYLPDSASDLVRDHVRAIQDAGRGLPAPAQQLLFDPRQDCLPHLSRQSLRDKLRAAMAQDRPYTIVHLLCHGGSLPEQDGRGLVWQGDGDVDLVDPRSFGELLLAGAPALRMLVLCACMGSDPGEPGSLLGSCGMSAHVGGRVDSVIASRFPLTMQGSVQLTEGLYQQLIGGKMSLEAAFLAARSQLSPNSFDRFAVQLYQPAGAWETRPFLPPIDATGEPLNADDYVWLAARERELGAMVARIKDLAHLRRRLDHEHERGEPRFLLLTGPRGSGTTSLLLGGLVPKIKMEGNWEVIRLSPTADCVEQLRRKLEALDAAVTALILIEPLEELFTKLPDAKKRQGVIQALWKWAQDPLSRHVIVATLGLPFLAECAELIVDERTGRRLDDVALDPCHSLQLRRLDANQLGTTVIQVAQDLLRMPIEAKLAERIAADLCTSPIAPLLVRLLLARLQECVTAQALTLADYLALCRKDQAVEHQSEELYASAPQPEQEWMRRTLVKLCLDGRPGVHGSLELAHAELAPHQDEGHGFVQALALLCKAGIVTQQANEAGQVVRLIAPSAMESWPWLQKQVGAERRHRHHFEQFRRWISEEHGESLPLVSGPQLAAVRSFLSDYGGAVPDAQALAELIQRTEQAANIARRFHDLALVSSAHALVGRGQRSTANRLLLEVQQPAQTRAFVETAHDVLARPVPWVTLRGHRGRVAWLAVSHDGKRVATAGQDGVARIYSVDSGSELAALSGHASVLRRVAFSASGALLCTVAAGLPAESLRVFYTDHTGRFRRLAGATAEPLAVAFSPDDERLHAVLADGTLAAWSTKGELNGEARQPQWTLPLPLPAPARRARAAAAPLSLAAFAASGDCFVVATADRVLLFAVPVSPQTLKARTRFLLPAADGPLSALCLDSTLESLYTSSVHGVVRRFALTTRGSRATRQPERIASHPGAVVFAVAQRAGRALLVMRSPDRSIVLHTLHSTAGIPTWPEPILGEHTLPIEHAATTPDGSVVVTAGHDFTPRIWRPAPGSEPLVSLPPGVKGHLADLSADGTRLLLHGEQRFFIVPLTTNYPQDAPLLSGRSSGRILAAALAPDGSRVALACEDGRVLMRSVAQRSARSWVGEHGAPVTAVRFNPEGTQLVSACGDEVVRLWSLAASGLVLAASIRVAQPTSVAFSPDGQSVLIGSHDGSLSLWHPHEGKLAAQLPVRQQPIQWAEFDRSGSWVVSACADGTAVVWDLQAEPAPRLVRELIGHVGAVHRAVFSADGLRVLTACADGTARVWNLEQARRKEATPVSSSDEVIVLRSPHANVEFCAFLAGGDVLTATEDGLVRTWCLSVEALQEQLQKANIDCLPPERRQTFLGESAESAAKAYKTCEAAHHRDS